MKKLNETELLQVKQIEEFLVTEKNKEKLIPILKEIIELTANDFERKTPLSKVDLFHALTSDLSIISEVFGFKAQYSNNLDGRITNALCHIMFNENETEEVRNRNIEYIKNNVKDNYFSFITYLNYTIDVFGAYKINKNSSDLTNNGFSKICYQFFEDLGKSLQNVLKNNCNINDCGLDLKIYGLVEYTFSKYNLDFTKQQYLKLIELNPIFINLLLAQSKKDFSELLKDDETRKVYLSSLKNTLNSFNSSLNINREGNNKVSYFIETCLVPIKTGFESDFEDLEIIEELLNACNATGAKNVAPMVMYIFNLENKTVKEKCFEKSEYFFNSLFNNGYYEDLSQEVLENDLALAEKLNCIIPKKLKEEITPLQKVCEKIAILKNTNSKFKFKP